MKGLEQLRGWLDTLIHMVSCWYYMLLGKIIRRAYRKSLLGRKKSWHDGIIDTICVIQDLHKANFGGVKMNWVQLDEEKCVFAVTSENALLFCSTAPPHLFCLPNTYSHPCSSALQSAVTLTPSKRAKAGPQRVSYTLNHARGRRRSEFRQYLVLHLLFCPPHSRLILPLLKLHPFLFVLFAVSADYLFIHLASFHKQCLTPDQTVYCIS